MTTCPKCNHVRNSNDDPNVPDYQCPKCNVIYKKYLAQLSETFADIPESNKIKRDNTNNIKKHKISSSSDEIEGVDFDEIPTKPATQITITFILSWLFGVLFLLSGIITLFSNVLSGLALILVSIIILPPCIGKVEEKFNLKLSTNLKTIAIFMLLFVPAIIKIPTTKSHIETKATEKPVSKLTMSEISNSISGKTDLQTQNYFDSKVKGRRVIWRGTVIDADTQMFNRDCYVDVKPEGTGSLGSARLYVSCNTANQLNKGRTIQFDGRIDNIADILGIHVYFNDPKITLI